MRDSFRIKPQPRSTIEIHATLTDYIRQRPDVGLDKFLLNLAFDPASPFDPKARRSLRKGFLLAALVVTGLVGTFVYFNFF